MEKYALRVVQTWLGGKYLNEFWRFQWENHLQPCLIGRWYGIAFDKFRLLKAIAVFCFVSFLVQMSGICRTTDFY